MSSSSFGDTLKKLESVLKTEHMMIVARVDHRNMLSMVGAKIRGATTVEFGKPEMGKMLLPMNPAIGLEMPARIYVYENADGKAVVSYRKVAANFADYGPEVAKAGEMMDMTLEKVASATAQSSISSSPPRVSRSSSCSCCAGAFPLRRSLPGGAACWNWR